MRLSILVLSVTLVLSSTGAQQRPQVEAPTLDVRKLMSTSEFSKSGLKKLTDDELQVFNAWLLSYSLRLLEFRGSTSDVIETRIEGDFEGWEGETIFKLDNGQIWQQDSYAYTYHYAYRPEVVIFKSGSRWKMKVDGVDSTIYVKRLK